MAKARPGIRKSTKAAPKKAVAKKKPASRKATVKKQKSSAKKAPLPTPSTQKDYYHYPARSEAEQMRGLPEDLQDAWVKLRALLTSFGEQRIYTSNKAIMFARRVCHAFVRPKKNYLELVFFLREPLKSDLLKKVESFTKTKSAHMYVLKHPDQVEEPLSDWLREAYELSGAEK